MPLGSPWLSKPIKKPMKYPKMKPDWFAEWKQIRDSGVDSPMSEFYDKVEALLFKQEEHHIAELLTAEGAFGQSLEKHYENKIKKLKQQHREELERTEKAFGGCTKCYGKGYSTYREGYQLEPDFIGDKQSKPIMQTHYIPCTCGRGKQITNLLEQKGK